jgi:hypothetical protein
VAKKQRMPDALFPRIWQNLDFDLRQSLRLEDLEVFSLVFFVVIDALTSSLLLQSTTQSKPNI